MSRILTLLNWFWILLTACNNTEPDIQVNKIISNVTSEKFNDLGGKNEYEESNHKDIKKLTFNFSMEHGERLKCLDWRTLLNEYDGFDRYWGGDSTSQDNIQENFNNL